MNNSQVVNNKMDQKPSGGGTKPSTTEISALDGISRFRTPQSTQRQKAVESPKGIMALKDKVAFAAKSYPSHGNAALSTDWSEF